jgi:hypothetical protein
VLTMLKYSRRAVQALAGALLVRGAIDRLTTRPHAERPADPLSLAGRSTQLHPGRRQAPEGGRR